MGTSTLAQRHVLITGAASGIGRLMTLKAAARGATVSAWDVDGHRLQALADELQAAGARHLTACCDLADPKAIDAAAAHTVATQGPVDVLVNNAGVVNGKWLLEASDAEIVRTFEINTLALFRTTRAFLPAMLERNRGHVVTIASAAGLAGVPRLTDYSASKFAAVGFDEALRVELRRRGSAVRTTVVCPYFIDTGMFAGAATRFPRLLPILHADDVAERVLRAVETGRRRLLLPPFVLTTLLIRALPPAAFDAAMAWFGVAHSMDRFHGHGGRGAAAATAATAAPTRPS